MAAPTLNTRAANRTQKRTLIRRMDQEQMVSRYLELRDSGEADGREARRLADELIGSFSRMIGAVISRRYYEIPAYVARTVDHDDLIAAGMAGVWKALDGHDQRSGASFTTYCYQQIGWAMASEVRRCDPLGDYTRRQVRHTQKKKAELREKLEREPTDGEAACAAGVSVSKLKELEGAFCRAVSVEMPEWWEASEADAEAEEYEAVA